MCIERYDAEKLTFEPAMLKSYIEFTFKDTNTVVACKPYIALDEQLTMEKLFPSINSDQNLGSDPQEQVTPST